METPKLCVCDLDETLLDSGKKLSDENINAVRALKNIGVQFTIATGRSHLQIREYIDTLGIDIPVITCNGGVTSMPKSEEMLNVSYINPKRAREICDYCEKKKFDYLMYTAENICYTGESKRILGYVRYNAELLNLGKNSEFAVPLRCMDAVGEADFACAIKILVLGNKDELSKIARKFNEDDALTIVSSGVGLIDIMAKGATKGGAVCALAERLGIAMEHVAVFGDSPNDISMFEVGGVRVAVENAVDEVKRLATFITKDNNQSGVAHALSRLFGSI